MPGDNSPVYFKAKDRASLSEVLRWAMKHPHVYASRKQKTKPKKLKERTHIHALTLNTEERFFLESVGAVMVLNLKHVTNYKTLPRQIENSNRGKHRLQYFLL